MTPTSGRLNVLPLTVLLKAGLKIGLAVGLMIGAPSAVEAQVKLVMKDGTHQIVKSYEVRGDRVRYYSVERSEWEEVPVSLVDLNATRRVQEEERSARRRAEEEARAIDKERFEQTAAAGYEVSPGVRLPTEEGVFAFDGRRVIRLVQSSAEVVTDKKRAALLLAMPGPLIKSRSLVVLPGPKAAVRVSVSQPTFYVQFADVSSATRLELIPVKPGKQARVVERVQSGLGAGKAGEVRTTVSLERTEIRPGLSKLRPTQTLSSGEYVLGELLAQKLNLELWDFGIDSGK